MDNVSPTRILFICMGNICRSPFAEYYLKARLAEGGTAAIPVTLKETSVPHSFCPSQRGSPPSRSP